MIKTIDLKEYADFFNLQEVQSIVQSPERIDSLTARNVNYELLGYYNTNQELEFVTIILYQNLRFGLKQALLIQGPVGAVEPSDNFKSFLLQLKAYLTKKPKVIRFVYSPDYTHRKYDVNFKPISEPLDQAMIELLERVGFKYMGDHLVGLSNRFIMKKDMREFKNEDEIFASYHKQNRKTINKLEEFHLEIDELSLDDLDRFIKIEQHTEATREFKARDEDYYKKTFAAFDKANKAKVTVAKFNMKRYQKDLEEKLDTVNQQLESFNQEDLTPHLQKKINVAKEQQASFNNRLKRINKLIEKYPQDPIDIATRFYLRTDTEYQALYGGSLSDFAFIPATTALYDDIIRKCHRENIPVYNYLGIYTEDDTYGEESDILRFKRGFGGEIHELIGEYELVVKPWQNRIYETLRRMITVIRK